MSRTPERVADRRVFPAALAATAAGLVLARAASRRCDGPQEDAGTLLLTAAHELRTPLTSLHLRLDLLAEALADEPPNLKEAREHAERAAAQSRALIRLANNLLRFTGSACVGRARPVELRELARQVIDEFEGARAPTGKVELDAAHPVSALGDPGAVAQILRILLDNALRFAPARTTISVRTRRRGRRSELTVCDSGPGVADGDRERIFGRFERAGQPAADGGLGLGLAIGRDLARRLGGELRLSSAASPTCFTLELPSVDAGSSSKSRPQADDTAGPARDDRASSSI
jgi:signal transduction histidine kinase